MPHQSVCRRRQEHVDRAPFRRSWTASVLQEHGSCCNHLWPFSLQVKGSSSLKKKSLWSVCYGWQDLGTNGTAPQISPWFVPLAARDKSQGCAWVNWLFFSTERQGFARAKPEGKFGLNGQEHFSSKLALPPLLGAGTERVVLRLWPCLLSALLQKAALQESFAGISVHVLTAFLFSSK